MKNDLVPKNDRAFGIGFVGADGTGKTTLLSRLSNNYSKNIRTISDIPRSVIRDGYPLGKNASTDSYIELNRRYQNELFQCRSADVPFFSERTAFDPFCYALVNSKIPRPQVRTEFIDFLKSQWLLDTFNYAAYFYFPIEFPLSADGVRVADSDYREAIDHCMYSQIQRCGVTVHRISGSPDARFEQATTIIEGLMSDEA